MMQGRVRVWNIAEALGRIGCHTVPQERLPASKNNYDVRRRFRKQVRRRWTSKS